MQSNSSSAISNTVQAPTVRTVSRTEAFESSDAWPHPGATNSNQTNATRINWTKCVLPRLDMVFCDGDIGVSLRNREPYARAGCDCTIGNKTSRFSLLRQVHYARRNVGCIKCYMIPVRTCLMRVRFASTTFAVGVPTNSSEYHAA